MNFIKKIWNGELPLVKVYWLYGVAVGLVLIIFSLLIKDYPTALISLTFALIPFQILVFVGIWRSADAYTNKKLWAVLAKVHVVLGVIAALNGVVVVSKNLNFNQSQISLTQNTANSNNATVNDEAKVKEPCYVYWDGAEFHLGKIKNKNEFTSYNLEKYGIVALVISLPNATVKALEIKEDKFDMYSGKFGDFWQKNWHQISAICTLPD